MKMPLNKTSENGIFFEPSLSDSTITQKQFHPFSDNGDTSASPPPAPISTNFDDVSDFMDALGIGLPDQVPPSTLPSATSGGGGSSSVPSSPIASGHGTRPSTPPSSSSSHSPSKIPRPRDRRHTGLNGRQWRAPGERPPLGIGADTCNPSSGSTSSPRRVDPGRVPWMRSPIARHDPPVSGGFSTAGHSSALCPTRSLGVWWFLHCWPFFSPPLQC